jgi:hypothetical protein
VVVRGEIRLINGIQVKTGERIDDNERETSSCCPIYRLLELNERAGAIDDGGSWMLEKGKGGNVRSCIDITGRGD